MELGDDIPVQMRAVWRLPSRFEHKDKSAMVANLQEIIGHKVTKVWYDYDWGLMLTLDDESVVIVEGVWHNDETAGTSAARWTLTNP